MYSVWVWLLILGVFIWLAGLTYLIFRERGILKSLFPKSGERDIRRKFEEVLKEISRFDNNLGDLEKRLEILDKEGLGYIQRVKLLRFNPYNDTGGDISFCLGLLNKEGTGVVVTSLHARGGTRIFAKPVEKGKGGPLRLSKEEEDVIKEAMILKNR